MPTKIFIVGEKTYIVKKVIDGDTIELDNGQVVRYIGVDAPETQHPVKKIQCFGKEATMFNKQLVEGKTIRMEKDVSETDKYKRLLRYVWLIDPNIATESGGIFINEFLVRQGYAYAATFPPDVKYANLFSRAQQEAVEKNRGLWSKCGNQ